MSDTSPAGRVPDPAYPADVPPQPAYDLTPSSAASTGGDLTPSSAASTGDDRSTARRVAEQTRSAAGDAASDVAGTAKEQVQRVGSEARAQARNVASEVRGKLSEQARTQNTRLVGGIRQTADHLDEMRGERPDSPAAAVVARVAEGGRQFADYLDRNGPDGVLREVEDFARRRPGAFLATALAAGFVVGRLGKSIAKADPDAGTDKPDTDTYTESAGTTGYASAGYPSAGVVPSPVPDESLTYVPASTGTGYVTPATTQYSGTGTGTPSVVAPGDPEYRS